MPYTPPNILDAPAGWKIGDPIPTGWTASTLNSADFQAWLTSAANYSFGRVVVGGNLGATYTFDLASDANVWLTGTLTASCTITITGRTAGARFHLLLAQDATGGRTLTISDGTTSQAVTIPTTASATTSISGYCPDATDIWIAPTTSASTGVTQAYQTVQDEGIALTQQSVVNFIGAGVTAANNAGSSRTDVTIPGGLTQAYATVQDEGTPLTQRSAVNFIGPSVTATDNAGTSTTDVTIRVQAERVRVLNMPTGAVAETYSRIGASSNTTATLASGTLRVVAGCVLAAGQTATTANWVTGSTAEAGGTHAWSVLMRRSDLTVLAVSADQTAAAYMGASTSVSFTFAAPYTATFETDVLLGVCVVATTTPTLVATTLGNPINVAPLITATSSTGLTTPPTVGTVMGALTSATNQPYAYIT